jgi:CRP-like cAMP-binding protein
VGNSLQSHVLELQQARAFLSATGDLAAMPEPLRANVLDRCSFRRFSAGESIYVLGDPPGGPYGLVAGGVALFMGQAERGPYFAHFGRPGVWFGEGSALTGQPRQVGAVATRDTTTLHLPLPAIRALASTDGEIWRWIAMLTSQHLGIAMGAIVDLMIRDPADRTIAVLLRLADRRLPGGPDDPVTVDTSQEELGAMTNLSRNAVGTILRRLEAAGMVRIAYRQVTLVSPDALLARLQT